MTSTGKQIVLLVIFLASLASVFWFRTYAGVEEPLDREAAKTRYGFYLEEVSRKAGIDFVHQGPILDSKLNHIMPIAAAMGAGVSVVDFDRDGWPDLYVVNSGPGSKCRLYRNKQDGSFEDVADALGVADLNRPGDGACMGAVWGDFDNDGFEDLFVYRWGKQDLFRNLGVDKDRRPLGFQRVTDRASLPAWVNTGSAIWLDFDSDGWLDLFVGGYWADHIDLWNLDTTKIMPESFEYAKNGGRKYLLRNKGKDAQGNWLGFEDVAEKMGVTSTRWVLAAAAADLRGAGFPDLVLAIDYGVNEYYANEDGKKFLDRSKETQVGDKPKSGMSVSFGDIFNEGRFCIYTTNITEPGVLPQFNNLWAPVHGQNGDAHRYENQGHSLGVDRGGWSWGAQFGDLNNDGLLDLCLTNGYVSANKHRSYWYDYSLLAGANTRIISDAANWPAMRGRSLSGYQTHCLWLNRDGKFADIAKAVGYSDVLDGRAVVLVDLWNRGELNIVQASQKGRLLVYKNNVRAANDWVQFELTGTKSNRSAIGAQVTVHWNDGKQIQEVSGGSGYAAQNQRRLHFGLGENARIDRVEIRWPSGARQTIQNPAVRKIHRIPEPA